MDYNEIAAKWWGDKIRNIGPEDFRDGKQNKACGMANSIQTMQAIETKPDEQTINRFEKVLARYIKKQVERYGGIMVYVDYMPCNILLSASEAVGMITQCWPWKTIMWVDFHNVEVADGYRKPVKSIYKNYEK